MLVPPLIPHATSIRLTSRRIVLAPRREHVLLKHEGAARPRLRHARKVLFVGVVTGGSASRNLIAFFVEGFLSAINFLVLLEPLLLRLLHLIVRLQPVAAGVGDHADAHRRLLQFTVPVADVGLVDFV